MNLNTPILFTATTDAGRARVFYEEVLGLEFVTEEVFALVFRCGGLQLRVQKVARKPEVSHTVLGWEVDDIRGAARRLAAAGVVFLRFDGLEQDADGLWQAPSGALVAWFHDPDANTLSLAEYPRPAGAGSAE